MKKIIAVTLVCLLLINNFGYAQKISVKDDALRLRGDLVLNLAGTGFGAVFIAGGVKWIKEAWHVSGNFDSAMKGMLGMASVCTGIGILMAVCSNVFTLDAATPPLNTYQKYNRVRSFPRMLADREKFSDADFEEVYAKYPSEMNKYIDDVKFFAAAADAKQCPLIDMNKIKTDTIKKLAPSMKITPEDLRDSEFISTMQSNGGWPVFFETFAFEYNMAKAQNAVQTAVKPLNYYMKAISKN